MSPPTQACAVTAGVAGIAVGRVHFHGRQVRGTGSQTGGAVGMRQRVLFRWALWRPSVQSVEMLSHSIGTFQYFFGSQAEYLVYCDQLGFLREHLAVPADLAEMDTPAGEFFDDRATWKKWAPRFRHDVGVTEFRVDADIFLVAEPAELREFIAGDGHDFVVTKEEFTARWPYGYFGPGLPQGFTPINAGFVGQRAGRDLTVAVRAAYARWADAMRHTEASHTEVKYHDEQGAIAAVLQEPIERGRVLVLDPARYRVVCPLNDPPVHSLDGIVAVHATYPDHPAYQRFLPEISRISGVSVRQP
jgi:hypothetical protein